MTFRKREAKVFASLAVSMTLVALLLKALGQNPPPAGAFCLTQYNDLPDIKTAFVLEPNQSPARWDSIEIFYSKTRGGNIEELAKLKGLSESGQFNCHFVVCNGYGGMDGQIQITKKWKKQVSAGSGRINDYEETPIRVCVIADKIARPTDFQIKRTEALVETLRRKHKISPHSVYYPFDWL